jgi:hypothetical protein
VPEHHNWPEAAAPGVTSGYCTHHTTPNLEDPSSVALKHTDDHRKACVDHNEPLLIVDQAQSRFARRPNEWELAANYFLRAHSVDAAAPSRGDISTAMDHADDDKEHQGRVELLDSATRQCWARIDGHHQSCL